MSTADAAERRDAARALLRTPFVTAADDHTLTLVRRHATALKSTFGTLLGYPLVVEATFARLVKAPLTDDTPARPARRSGGGEFTTRTYTYLALLCAALLAPDVGDQVLASTLVEQLRADAATAGLTLGDSHAEQRDLVTAFRQLIAWGVLAEIDGTISGWGERHEEALLTVHRPMLPHLLSRPLAGLDTPDALLAATPDLVEQPRRSLRRKLVENPLVRREDLTDAERDVLSRERSDLSRVLDDNFGLILEVRAEGALTYDPDRDVTDDEFPGPGTVKQAALLLVDALLAEHTPTAGVTAVVGGDVLPGVRCRWESVDRIIEHLAAANGKAWGADYVSDPGRLRDDAVAVLTAVSLVEATEDGLVVHPAAARHRIVVAEGPARTRAQQRLSPLADPTPAPGPDLFNVQEMP